MADHLKSVAVFFFLLAILSFPISFLNGPVLTFGSHVIFKFNIAKLARKIVYSTKIITTYSNGTQVAIIVNQTALVFVPIGNGTVTLNAKGSLSAGNQLDMHVTAYFRQDAFSSKSPNISFTPLGAFASTYFLGIPQDSPQTDSLGLPKDVSIPLEPNGNSWVGDNWVIYNQGGSFNSTMSINNSSFVVVGPIQIGTQDATITARTNALLVSLTWVIIAFSALELRKK